MLYLIGLGLDLKELSLKALEAIKSCKAVYLETYTTTFPYKIEDLEKLIGKKVIPSARKQFEEDMPALINQAKRENISVLVYGDPLSATTHIILLKEAQKLKVKTETIHNNSILTAASDTGLSLYKFGKTISLPKWKENYRPTSFMQVIKENLSINAHTLILVDPGMDLKTALNQIKEADQENTLKDKEIIIFAQAGTKKQEMIKGKINLLVGKKIQEPFSIIVPSNLSFGEE